MSRAETVMEGAGIEVTYFELGRDFVSHGTAVVRCMLVPLSSKSELQSGR